MGLVVYFIIAVILFSLAYWVINTLVPDGQAKKLLTILLVVVAAIFVCYMLYGLVGGGSGVELPRLRH